MIIANFMDSSLQDLRKKGVFDHAPEIYNPGRTYEKVIHFTPHADDMELQPHFEPWNIQLVHYRQSSRHRIVRLFKALIDVWRILGEERVQLVRGRLPYLGSLIGVTAACLRGIPSVVSLGGDNRIVQRRNGQYYYNRKSVSFTMEWLVLRLADSIIVPNQFTRRYVAGIIGKRRAENKCRVIPWLSKPLKPNEAGDLRQFDFPENHAIVPIIGFLNSYKHIDVLFDALEGWPSPQRWRDKIVFCFCGEGPLKEEGISRFAHRDDVRFLGWQDHATVAALIIEARCVLVPMSGLVLLEAASAGKPVITSDVEWHQELISNGDTGLVVDATNPEQWRSAIDMVIRDPQTAAEMGVRLRKRYERDYSPERSVQLEHELYRQLIAGQR